MTIVDQSVSVTATSTGKTATSGTTTTVGSWDTAIASTSAETYWVHLTLNTVEQDEVFMVEVGVDSVSKIGPFPVFLNAGNGLVHLAMPLTIAAGSAVQVRCAATTGTRVLQYWLGVSNESAYGTSTANQTIGVSGLLGTDVDPGAVNNTKGAYVQLSASTSMVYDYFILLLGNSDNNTQTAQTFLVDVATGAAASEVDQIKNTLFISSAIENSTQVYLYWHTIATSTRVTVRCQSSSTVDANDRLIDAAIIGFTVTAPAGGSPSGVRNPLRGPIG